jgi:hypothetical protein
LMEPITTRSKSYRANKEFVPLQSWIASPP